MVKRIIPEHTREKYDGMNPLEQTRTDVVNDLYCHVCNQSFANKVGAGLHIESGKHESKLARLISDREGGAPAATQVKDVGKGANKDVGVDLLTPEPEPTTENIFRHENEGEQYNVTGTGVVRLRKLWDPSSSDNVVVGIMLANYDNGARIEKEGKALKAEAKGNLDALMPEGYEEMELGPIDDARKIAVLRFYAPTKSKKLDPALLLTNGVSQDIIDDSYVETERKGHYKIERAKAVD